MKKIDNLKKSTFSVLGFALTLMPSYAQVTTFDYTVGEQLYTVPAGVNLIQIEVSGGQGGSGDGGERDLGATMIGTFAVTPGDVYVVAVGGAGAQYGNSRGGTGVLFETIPLIVAGGGGGGAINAVGGGGLITEEGGSSSGAGGTAGGGGSYNDAIDQVNTPSNHAGAGQAIITVICPEIVVTYTTTLEAFGGDAAIDNTVSGGDGTFVFDWDNDGTGDFDDSEGLTDLVAGNLSCGG